MCHATSRGLLRARGSSMNKFALLLPFVLFACGSEAEDGNKPPGQDETSAPGQTSAPTADTADVPVPAAPGSSRERDVTLPYGRGFPSITPAPSTGPAVDPTPANGPSGTDPSAPSTDPSTPSRTSRRRTRRRRRRALRRRRMIRVRARRRRAGGCPEGSPRGRARKTARDTRAAPAADRCRSSTASPAACCSSGCRVRSARRPRTSAREVGKRRDRRHRGAEVP